MARTGRTAVSQRTQMKYETTEYIRGNAVRRREAYGAEDYDARIRRQLEEEPKRSLSNETRKNRDKAHHMSLGYVTFLLVALFACGIILFNYIQLQSEITAKAEHIAVMESTLNNLKLSNDEAYNRITRNIDLEEIKRIAIGELGMVYAREDQIITYSGVDADYMRQVDIAE